MLLKELNGSDDPNSRHLALVKASLTGMHIHNGQEGILLLTTSDRVLLDLTENLEAIQKEKKKENPSADAITYNIVLREWLGIPLESEYRAFVHNKQLTAISQ